MGWRDIKRAAKAVVHATFQVPAIYLPDRALVPVNCQVRLHDKVTAMGLDGGEGTMLEIQPKLVFAVAEVPNPLPRAYVFLSAQEVYRLGASEPTGDGYIAAAATRMDAASAQNIITLSGIDLSSLADTQNLNGE